MNQKVFPAGFVHPWCWSFSGMALIRMDSSKESYLKACKAEQNEERFW
jgi:hypothetical protein